MNGNFMLGPCRFILSSAYLNMGYSLDLRDIQWSFWYIPRGDWISVKIPLAQPYSVWIVDFGLCGPVSPKHPKCQARNYSFLSFFWQSLWVKTKFIQWQLTVICHSDSCGLIITVKAHPKWRVESHPKSIKQSRNVTTSWQCNLVRPRNKAIYGYKCKSRWLVFPAKTGT